MSTILYVDDEQAVRTVVRRLLERRGVIVHTAGSVAEATAALEQTPVEGVVIDLWLGDGTAFDLHAWIREHRPALAQRIAFVTGDIAETMEGDRSLSALGCPVFGKPLDYEALLAVVRGWGSDRGMGNGELGMEERPRGA